MLITGPACCRSLREEHTRATAELARLSHTRRHVLSAAPDAESAQTSQNAERKAASAALQGLIGTRFQQGNFLELVSLAASPPSPHCSSIFAYLDASLTVTARQ